MSADDEFARWVEAARAVPVAEAIAARAIAMKRAGAELVGPCPVCGGHDRFSVNLRKNVWHCRGSGRGGDAISLVEYLDGADFIAACETLAGTPPPRGSGARLSEAALAARAAERQAAEARRAAEDNIYRARERVAAHGWWLAGGAIADTAAAAYLMRRGLDLPATRTLRFHRDMPYFHGSDARGNPVEIHRGPALLAAITDAGGRFQGLHITWIDLDTAKGKAAIRDPDDGAALPAKKVRGSLRGGCIVLVPAEPARAVIAGEGIETTLTAWTALRRTGADLSGTQFQCGVSLGNLAGPAASSVPHPTLVRTDAAGRRHPQRVPGPVPDLARPAMPVPDACTRLTLLADGDSDPFATACAMMRAEARHATPERSARTAWAPSGSDFNDMLMDAAA